jgi:hypothetical protein
VIDTSGDAPAFTGHAFGLELRAAFAIPDVLDRQSNSSHPNRRVVTLTLSGSDGPEDGWPVGSTKRTFQLDGPDDRSIFTIDHHPTAGYRVWIDGLGLCIIAFDGSRITYTLPTSAALRWRLLFGQGLPIAAALRGLEVLHASAVVLNGEALAFAARPGTGKTSLALSLLTMGAEFLADDVVALEAGNDRLVAHPGLRIAHVHGSDEAALLAAGIDPGRSLDPAVKHHVTLPLRKAAAPLGALYFIRRAAEFDRIQIIRLDPPDPRVLLGATFVAHVPVASRAITQLEICAQLTRTVPTFQINAPVEGSSSAVAEQVARQRGAIG